MENLKDPLKFEIVQDTMFFPLYGRALYSQNPKYKFKDEQAEAIVNKLGVNLSEISNYYSELKQLGMAGRAETYDTLIKKYLKGFPNATVVNI
jgi:O-methyltransferase involved in polyketide biosynthesis